MLPTSQFSGIKEDGVDEAGRGCIAGPVVAAAVILPEGYSHELLTDSKTLTENQREEARAIIIENAIDFAVGICSPQTIDEINILNASILAMHKALEKLRVHPEHISVDGNRFKPWKFIPYSTVVKGDAKLANIAAASIMAKTTRDMIMKKIGDKFPDYGFKSHKGYPTKSHYEIVRTYGPTPWHRMTFKGVK